MGLKIGILENRDYDRKHKILNAAFVEGCKKYDMEYEFIDFHAYDWYEKVMDPTFDGFFHRAMYWPNEKDMAMEKIYAMEQAGLIVHPTSNMIMLYENKRAIAHYLQLNGFPYIPTMVCYKRDEAMIAGEVLGFPIVVKTSLGSSSHGVSIVRDKEELMARVDTSFSSGIPSVQKHHLSRHSIEYDSIILQKFIPNATEWRITVCGNKYWGRINDKPTKDFRASGTGLIIYDDPPREVLDIARRLRVAMKTEVFCVDILESDGEYYISEFSVLFGTVGTIGGDYKQPMLLNGVKGWYSYDKWKDKYDFVEGDDQINVARMRVLSRTIERKKRGYDD